MDNEVSYYINEMFDRMKFWNNNNITKSTLVAIRDLIYSNNEGLIKVKVFIYDLNHFFIFKKGNDAKRVI